jgi:hypothetical protein
MDAARRGIGSSTRSKLPSSVLSFNDIAEFESFLQTFIEGDYFIKYIGTLRLCLDLLKVIFQPLPERMRLSGALKGENRGSVHRLINNRCDCPSAFVYWHSLAKIYKNHTLV